MVVFNVDAVDVQFIFINCVERKCQGVGEVCRVHTLGTTDVWSLLVGLFVRLTYIMIEHPKQLH